MQIKKKIKIGTVQINNSFSNQSYLPYSIGVLQAYSQKYTKNIDDFEFLLPIYKRIKIKDALSKLKHADIVLFSVYVWNFNLSREIAKKLKRRDNKKLIIFGGCHIPKKRIEEFLIKNPFIDIACISEGEIVLKEILENYPEKSWGNVPSIAYRNKNNIIMKTPICERIKELDEIPSPYLDNVFKPLMDSVPKETWIALWETNRGCPYGCSYCEWGGNYQKKIYKLSLQRLKEEIDWMSENKIEYIFCCDSNFGIFERDLEIVKKIAENKRIYNYPQAFSIQNAKSSGDRTYQIMKILSKSDLSKGANLAFQSTNIDTLNSIGRVNISNDIFTELQKKFNKDGIETFSDIILGLPEETYDTYKKGIDTLINNGQHNRIQFFNLSLLQNSEMGTKEYQEKYGLKSVKSRIMNVHGSLSDDNEIPEFQKLVTATNKMPENDWVSAKTFSYMISFLHFDKILQLLLVILNSKYNIIYSEVVESFLNSSRTKYPVIAEIRDYFKEKSLNIQKGKEEYCKSEKWLNIWWPADELKIIDIFTSGKYLNFYAESEELLNEILISKSIMYDSDIIKNSILLNKEIIKLPFGKKDQIVELDYNIWEVYKSALAGKKITLEKKKIKYRIEKNKEKWESWEEWCQKVVWYCNRRGAYIYNCEGVN